MAFPFLALGMGILGGVGNLIAGNEAEQQDRRRRELAISQLREGLIDSGELDQMLRNQDRLFNNRLQSTLNTTAIRTRGLANRGVVGAAAAGAINAQSAQARINTEQAVQRQNIGINQSIARAQLGGPENSPTGNFLSGFLGGAGAGLQAEQMLSDRSFVPGEQPTAGLTEQATGPSGNTGNTGGIQNPFLGAPKIDGNYLYNFQSPSANQRLFRGF